MTEATIRSYTPRDESAWNAYVASHPKATVCHLAQWSHIINDVLGHCPLYLIAEHDDRVCGVLPLFLVTTWWRSRFLVSIPWLDYGGPLADDAAIEQRMIEEAAKIGKEHDVAHAELRTEGTVEGDAAERTDKVTFRLDLSPGREEVWKAFNGKLRNQVRKSEKSGLTTRVGGMDLLDRFYTVFSRNMRDLGTPVWGRNLFVTILERLPDFASIISVEDDGTTVAAGLQLDYNGTRYVPSASSYREARAMCPNHALYWRLISDGCDAGDQTFDFGRSTWNGPTFRFKKQWTPDPIQLHWQYLLADDVNAASDKSRLELFIKIWQKLPVGVANRLGPHVIKNFP